jgi:serine/threonine protein kinase
MPSTSNPSYLITVVFLCFPRSILITDGSYGFVVSAIDAVTGNKVAIKKVKETFADVVDAKRILREL